MNPKMDTALADKAIRYAVEAHSGTGRKGKGFPYVVHPLEAMEIVSTITDDPEMLAAAALHDTVEDTPVTWDDLRREFGERVARLVAGDTQQTEGGWRERRKAVCDRLRRLPWDEKVVALGDKLSNMRALYRDYKACGDALWSRFHAPGGKSDYAWYYRELAWALLDLAATEAYKEYLDKLDKTFGIEDGEVCRIDLRDYEESGAGYNGVSCNSRNGRTMIKMYGEGVPMKVALQELEKSRSVWRMGIETPIAGRLVYDGSRYGVEYARVMGKRSYARAISDEPENLDRYAAHFAQCCKRLHSIPCSPHLFKPAAEQYRSLIASHPRYSEAEKQKMYRFLEQVPEECACIHGDMHTGNLIMADGQDLWIDLGDFGCGCHLYDMGMLYLLCRYGKEELVQDVFHVGREAMGRVWTVFVKEYFGADTHEKVADVERTVRPFAALKAFQFPIFRDDPEVESLIKTEFLEA